MDIADFYKNLIVHKTIEISDKQKIVKVSKDMVEDYIALSGSNKFSYRILLPRQEKDIKFAKNLGLGIQLEFLSELKKKKIRVKLREIKYIHDSGHFGWLLLDSDFSIPNFDNK
ncbi:MAG: hypothetical protein R3321_08440 [Nitrososphaeraceae archaeon]|nr:hypothetical protein [Nitrososphaeraceae archaeon]